MYHQRRGLDTDPNAGGTNPTAGGPLATDSSGGVPGGPLPTFQPSTSKSSTSSSSSSSSPSDASAPDSSATNDTQSSPAQPIPLGAVIGAIVGSIIFLVLVIALVVWQSKKQKRKLMNRSVSTRRNYERRKSGREMAWKELSDDHSTTIEGGGGIREDKGGMALQSYPPQRTTATSVGTIPQLPKLSPIFDSKELKNVIGRDLTPSPATPLAPPDSSEPLRSNYIGHPYNNYSRGPSPPPAAATSPYKDEKATTRDVDSGNGGQDIQYKPFTHPYAKALVPPSPVPTTTSSTSNPEDDKSFYTMSSPGLNNTSFSTQQQHQSSSSSQLLSNPPLSSAQPSSTILPLKTGDRSHNHNPFFTAHPSANEYNKSGRERWGSVGKERVVSIGSEETITKGGGFLSPPDSTPPSGAGTGAERAPSRMESLIAALELSDGTGGGASNTVSPTPTIKGSEANNRAQRTQFGQLASLYSISSRASTQPGEFELAYGDAIGTNTTHYSNPFEFDEVYGIPKIHSEAEGGEVRDSFRSSGVGGLGTSTTADFSMQGSTMTDGSSSGLVLSPSEFPMPPPR